MTHEIAPNLLRRRPDRGFDWARIISYAAMFALSYAMYYAMGNRPHSDISIHATWAAECDFRDFDSFFHHGTHVMWHVLVAILLRLNIPLVIASALVTAACKTVVLALVNRLYAMTLGANRWWLAALSFATCIVSPLYQTVLNVYISVGMNPWHSCTQQIAMVWMVLGVTYVAHCYDAFERLIPTMGDKAVLPWRKTLTLCAILGVSLFAKPTFMQVFLPAACLFFGYQWLRHPKNSRFFLRVIVSILPAVALMVLQYLYYFGIIVPHQSSMVWKFSFEKLYYTLLYALFVQAFPLSVLVACRKRIGKNTLYWLTLVFDVVGILEYIVLGESGRRAGDDNFGWGMAGAALMMWIVSFIPFVRCLREDWRERRRPRPWHIASIALLCWHIGSGVYYYVYLMGSDVAF